MLKWSSRGEQRQSAFERFRQTEVFGAKSWRERKRNRRPIGQPFEDHLYERRSRAVACNFPVAPLRCSRRKPGLDKRDQRTRKAFVGFRRQPKRDVFIRHPTSEADRFDRRELCSPVGGLRGVQPRFSRRLFGRFCEAQAELRSVSACPRLGAQLLPLSLAVPSLSKIWGGSPPARRFPDRRSVLRSFSWKRW